MTIDWLKDKETGVKFYPVTHEDAVIDSNGNTLSTNLGNKSDKSTTVTNVSYDSTSKKILKTINGTTSDVVTLATVATSGSYNDLSNKPDLSLKENISNKVTSISSSSTNTLYPSALAVYNALQAIDTGSDSGTCPDLSKGTTTGSGNAVTDITVSGHTITLDKGASFATLDSNGLVSANQLPSYVDDVIDGYKYGTDFYRPLVDGELKMDATSSDFTDDNKVTPVKSKIYFWVGDGHCYRWSGTEYVLIVASPGTTSNVPEGSNLYFTDARALAAVATLLSGKADKVVPSAANNVALLNASGNLVDSEKTLGKSVPSNAVFTDVACNEQYHYTPSTADNSSNIDLVPGGVLKIITAINLDSRKHVVSVTSGDLTKSMVGLNAVTNDRQVKGLSSGTTFGHVVTFGSDGYTIVDSGVAVTDLISSDTGGDYLPSVSSSDNNKMLLVVSGSWALVTPPTIYSGSTTPSSSLGSNGDIYIKTS